MNLHACVLVTLERKLALKLVGRQRGREFGFGRFSVTY
jgi:hypothetical protein